MKRPSGKLSQSTWNQSGNRKEPCVKAWLKYEKEKYPASREGTAIKPETRFAVYTAFPAGTIQKRPERIPGDRTNIFVAGTRIELVTSGL